VRTVAVALRKSRPGRPRKARRSRRVREAMRAGPELVEIDSTSGEVTNVWPIAGAPDVDRL
jgi:hypothetical protein